MEREEINIHSSQVEDIFTKIPNWITRWGISVIFSILLFIVIVSNFIIYPEVIRGKILIQNNHLNIAYCLFQIPQEQVYRIKTGNEVILKFERYPFQKFGVVKAQIVNISDSSINGNFLFTIKLVDQLNKYQNMQVVIKKNMSADCEIIVDKKSIFKRLFHYVIDSK